jgi:hypothetical protein
MKRNWIIMGSIIIFAIGGLILNFCTYGHNRTPQEPTSSTTTNLNANASDTAGSNQATTFFKESLFPYSGDLRVYPAFKVASVDIANKTFDRIGCGAACQKEITTVYKIVPETNVIMNGKSTAFQDIKVGTNVVIRGIPQADGSVLVKQVFLDADSIQYYIYITNVDFKNMTITGRFYDGTSTDKIDTSSLSGSTTLNLIPQTVVQNITLSPFKKIPTSELKTDILTNIFEVKQEMVWSALEIDMTTPESN